MSHIYSIIPLVSISLYHTIYKTSYSVFCCVKMIHNYNMLFDCGFDIHDEYKTYYNQISLELIKNNNKYKSHIIIIITRE